MFDKWWERSVIYQIWPKSFCDSNGDGIGDLPGIQSKLDYLKDLGVDILWLSPIYRSPDRDNGYDISDYYSIQPNYGTMEDFDSLLQEVHRRGMKLVMDLVMNHTSDQCEWFQKGIEDPNSKYHDYYYWRKGKGPGVPPNNWNAVFKGSAWTYNEKNDEWYLGCFSPFQPDLNWSNPELRQEIYKMVRFWLDKGIDGFRLDAIGYIGKNPELPDSPDGSCLILDPCVHTYLQELNRQVLSHYDIMTVGENANLTVEDMEKFASLDGGELNMMIQFFHVEEDIDEFGKFNLNRVNLPHLKQLYRDQQEDMYGKFWTSLYWSNHDQPRQVSRLGTEDPKYRDRAAKMIAMNTHMMMGTPFVYQGEELGMTNLHWDSLDELRDLEELGAWHEFVDSGRKSPEEMMECIRQKGRDNARTPIQWSAEKNAGFTDGTPWIRVNPNYTEINAAAELEDPDSVLNFYKKLIALRHTDEIVISGQYHGIALEDPQVFAYTRGIPRETWLILCNFSGEKAPFDWRPYLYSSSEEPDVVLGNVDSSDFLETGTLEPWEGIILRCRT